MEFSFCFKKKGSNNASQKEKIKTIVSYQSETLVSFFFNLGIEVERRTLLACFKKISWKPTRLQKNKQHVANVKALSWHLLLLRFIEVNSFSELVL